MWYSDINYLEKKTISFAVVENHNALTDGEVRILFLTLNGT